MSLPAAFPPALPVWPTTSSTLGELLGFDSGPKFQCLGQTKQVKRCENRTSKANSTLVSGLLAQIVTSGSFNTAKSLLTQVIDVVLCQHHKNQSPSCLDSWKRNFDSSKTRGVKIEGKDDKSILTGLQAKSTRSPRVSKLSPEPPVKIEKETPKKSYLTDPKSPSSGHSSPKSPKSKSSKPNPAKPTTQVHKFEPFGKPLSPFERNKAIKKLILRPLIPKEKTTKGCIYIYTFPDNYRDVSPYLKIGYASDLESRMAAWKSKCRYTPQVLGSFPCELSVKVEKLVHAELKNERKCEAGGCPACGVKHHEWFNVRSSKAAGTIGLWTDWTRLDPYDQDGNLKNEWRARVERVDLSDPGCWNEFVNGQHDEDGETSDEDESDDDEDIESVFSEDDNSNYSSGNEYDSYSSGDEDDE